METTAKDVCCPEFDPAPWDGQEITWDRKQFVADHITSVFHIPLNFKSVLMRNLARIESAGAKPERMITLTEEKSLWGADVYMEVTRDVPEVRMTTLSGTFMTKVFEGPYKNVPMWMREMREHVASAGREVKNLYCYYTTCPKCAKEHGKNYVVLLAQV